MASGREVLRDIDSQIDSIKDEERAYTKSIQDNTDEIANLMSGRERIVSALAMKYLPDLSDQSVASTISELQSRAQQALEQKRRRRTELADIISQNDVETTSLARGLDDVTITLKRIMSERDRLAEDVRVALEGRQDYMQLQERAEQLKSSLDIYQGRVQAMNDESAHKLLAYRANKIFMYLLRKDFDPSHPGKGLIARLDAWAASTLKVRVGTEVYDYSRALKEYKFLLSMPELMKIEFERTTEEYRGVLQNMEDIAIEIADKLGLTAVVEEFNHKTTIKQDALTRMDSLQSQRESYASELDSLDNSRGDYYYRVKSQLESYLASTSLEELRRIALASPDPEDDVMVERLGSIDEDIRGIEASLELNRTEREKVRAKLKKANKFRSQYESNHYNSSRSEFDDGFDVGTLLTGYVLGRMSESSVWNSVGSSHSRTPEPTVHSHTVHHDSGFSNFGGGFGGGGGGFSNASGGF